MDEPWHESSVFLFHWNYVAPCRMVTIGSCRYRLNSREPSSPNDPEGGSAGSGSGLEPSLVYRLPDPKFPFLADCLLHSLFKLWKDSKAQCIRKEGPRLSPVGIFF